MQVTKTVEETRKQIKAWKKEGKTVGLVPTMGFLHEGHASLIKKCREQNDVVVVDVYKRQYMTLPLHEPVHLQAEKILPSVW